MIVRPPLNDRLKFALGVLLRGVPQLPPRRRPGFEIPDDNPLASGEGETSRQEAALSLMDPDCVGFLLLTVRRDFHGPGGEVRFAHHLQPSWWPSLCLTLERIQQEAMRALPKR